jgi:hypothetical protein
MATCKECKYCEVHVGYWICNGEKERKARPLHALEIDGMENCSHFDRI